MTCSGGCFMNSSLKSGRDALKSPLLGLSARLLAQKVSISRGGLLESETSWHVGNSLVDSPTIWSWKRRFRTSFSSNNIVCGRCSRGSCGIGDAKAVFDRVDVGGSRRCIGLGHDIQTRQWGVNRMWRAFCGRRKWRRRQSKPLSDLEQLNRDGGNCSHVSHSTGYIIILEEARTSTHRAWRQFGRVGECICSGAELLLRGWMAVAVLVLPVVIRDNRFDRDSDDIYRSERGGMIRCQV